MSWQDSFYKQFEDFFSKKDLELVRFTQDIGYSIVGEYPKNYKRLMRVTKQSHYKPMYKFAARVDSANDVYIPMYVSAALTLEEEEEGRKRYILSYGKINGITPVDFTSIDDFYIRKSNGKLFEKVGNKYKELSYQALFKRVERAHLSHITDVRALWLRVRILIMRKFPSHLLTFIAYISSILTWTIEGKRFKYDVLEESFMEGYGTKRLEEASTKPKEQIDFFGYKVSIWTLSTFSLLVLIVAILSRHFRLPYYDIFIQSPGPLLSVAFAIVAIVVYDKITPRMLKKIVKGFQITAYNLKNKGMRLKI